MRGRLRLAACVVMLLAGGALLWYPWGQTLERSSANVAAPTSRTEPALATPNASSAPASSDAADQTSGDAVQPTRAEDATTPADPLATWVVEAHALRGWKDPFPGAELQLSIFSGFEATGTPLATQRAKSDEEGHVRWPLRPPTMTVTLKATAELERCDVYSDDEIVAIGNAPRVLEVRIYAKDATVTGIVRDPDGTPLHDVQVKNARNETRTDERGLYSLPASSIRQEESISAIAPGFALARVTAQIPEPGAKVIANIDLVPSFRVRGRVVDEVGAPVEGAVVRSFFTMQTSVTTGVDGSYLLDQLDPARRDHSVYARKDGYCEAATHVVVEGSELTIPDLVLTRGVRIEGAVVDESGAPIPAARLYIGFSPSAYNRLDAVAKDDGSFVFPNVPVGEQTLVTSADGCAPDRRTLQIVADPPVVHDVVIRLGHSHFVAGIVRSDDGNPVKDVGVSARHGGEYIEGRTMTAADGTFRLEGLPPSDVALELWGRSVVRKSVPVTELDVDDLEITVQRSGKVAGRVVDGVTGEPVTSFSVRFVAPDAPAERSFGYAATWAREGHKFHEAKGRWDSGDEQLPPGGVLGIEVRAEGYAPTRVGRAVASLDPDPEQCVARMFAGARVTGHVLDETGKPVAAARVALKAASDPDRHFSAEPYEAGTAVSGTDGAFEIAAAAPGPSVLLVQTKRPLFVDGPFDVPPSGSIDRVIRLTSGVTLVGELQDASGAPLASEKVMVFAMEVPGVDHFNTEVRTDADGRFEANGLLDGLYQVGHVVGEGNTSVQEILRFVRVGAGRENRVVLRPVGDGTIAGTIAMKDGSAPPDRISVSVFAAGDPSAPRETTPPGRGALATDGRFQIDGVEPGEYSIHVFQWSPSRQLSGSAKLTVNHDRQDVRIELVDVPRR